MAAGEGENVRAVLTPVPFSDRRLVLTRCRPLRSEIGPHPLSPSPIGDWSSPPVPLSLRERGNDGSPLECAPQECFEARAADVPIPDTDDAVTSGFEQVRAGGVVGLSVTPVVRIALQLHHKPLGDAIEVRDEAVQDVLAAKLEAEHAAVPQQPPRVALGRRCRSAELTRQRERLGGREVAKGIHGPRLALPRVTRRTKTARARA